MNPRPNPQSTDRQTLPPTDRPTQRPTDRPTDRPPVRPAHRLLSLIGLEITPNNHREKCVSGLGAFLAILAITMLTRWLLGPGAVMPVVASMGASAVLLFATPHGPLSQPWPLVGGHLFSALAGVTCAKYIPDPTLAAGASVGLAVTLMYYGRCIHPPGGATALTAVLAGPALRQLGYAYVLLPVGLNVAAILACAIAFNYCFPWRRYPAALGPAKPDHDHQRLTPEDWTFALAHADSMADVSEEELTALHSLAVTHAAQRRRGRRN